MKHFWWALLFCIGITFVLTSVPATRAEFLSLASSEGNIFITASSFGTPNPVATLIFESPTGVTIPANQLSTISISADGLGETSIDGIQVIVTLTGTLPTDLTFQAASVPEMNTVIQSVSATGTQSVVTLVCVSSNPLFPLIAHGQKTALGTLQFTSPDTGKMTITVDPSRTKILQTTTGTNILGPQVPSVFSFK